MRVSNEEQTPPSQSASRLIPVYVPMATTSEDGDFVRSAQSIQRVRELLHQLGECDHWVQSLSVDQTSYIMLETRMTSRSSKRWRQYFNLEYTGKSCCRHVYGKNPHRLHRPSMIRQWKILCHSLARVRRWLALLSLSCIWRILYGMLSLMGFVNWSEKTPSDPRVRCILNTFLSHYV